MIAETEQNLMRKISVWHLAS